MKLEEEKNRKLKEKKKIFGVELKTLYYRDEVKIVKVLLNILEKKGAVDKEGIIRHNGVKSRVDYLKAGLEENYFEFLRIVSDQTTDINDVASLLKQFLKELPIKIFPKNLNHHLDKPLDIENLRLVVHLLPEENSKVLDLLIIFLRKIIDNSKINKMDPFNLSKILVPTLFEYEDEVIDNKPKQKFFNFLESLLENYTEVKKMTNEDIINSPIIERKIRRESSYLRSIRKEMSYFKNFELQDKENLIQGLLTISQSPTSFYLLFGYNQDKKFTLEDQGDNIQSLIPHLTDNESKYILLRVLKDEKTIDVLIEWKGNQVHRDNFPYKKSKFSEIEIKSILKDYYKFTLTISDIAQLTEEDIIKEAIFNIKS